MLKYMKEIDKLINAIDLNSIVSHEFYKMRKTSILHHVIHMKVIQIQ